jgi:hypothetical protein
MPHQLRSYRVKAGQMDAFLRLWEEQVLPARQQHGFAVHGAWVNRADERFVWLVSHDDFDAADRAYYDSPARAAIDPPPGELLAAVHTTLLEQVWSPPARA